MTHPYHPLCGREFELVDRRRCWGEDRVYFCDDEGCIQRLAATWTDARDADPFLEMSAGRAHFRFDDLMELAGLFERLDRSRAPSGGHGA